MAPEDIEFRQRTGVFSRQKETSCSGGITVVWQRTAVSGLREQDCFSVCFGQSGLKESNCPKYDSSSARELPILRPGAKCVFTWGTLVPALPRFNDNPESATTLHCRQDPSGRLNS
jgi:hypothetical protein